MGFLGHLLYPWGFLLQGLAIVHFIAAGRIHTGSLSSFSWVRPERSYILPSRRFPTSDWSVSPSGLSATQAHSRTRSRDSRQSLGRKLRRTRRSLHDDGKFAAARAAFDKAIGARADTPDPFYRRGVCAIQLGDAAAALPDLERVVGKEPGYDFQRAAVCLRTPTREPGKRKKPRRSSGR